MLSSGCHHKPYANLSQKTFLFSAQYPAPQKSEIQLWWILLQIIHLTLSAFISAYGPLHPLTLPHPSELVEWPSGGVAGRAIPSTTIGAESLSLIQTCCAYVTQYTPGRTMSAPITTMDQFMLARFAALTGTYIGKLCRWGWLEGLCYALRERTRELGEDRRKQEPYKSITIISPLHKTEAILTTSPNLPRSKFGCGGKIFQAWTSNTTIGTVNPIWKHIPPQLTTAWKGIIGAQDHEADNQIDGQEPAMAWIGTPKRALMCAKKAEKGKARSRAMLQARRLAAVLVPRNPKIGV